VTQVATGSLGSFVHGDDEVLRALLRRRAAGSQPGARTEGQRIALVIGGGGMRGAYSGGMVAALDELNLRDCFDTVYGTSSGAFTAGAFVTGQGWGAGLIFQNHLACKAFIDVRRAAARGRPMVSLDYVIEVLTGANPMKWDVFLDSPIPLRVVATRLPDLQPHTLTGLETVEDWQVVMRAASSIPLLAGPPVDFGGDRWIDGSVSEPLAVGRALAEGATHVLTLLCRASTEVREQPGAGPAGLPFWGRSLDRLVPGLGTVANGSRRYSESLRMIRDVTHPGRGGAHLMAISPAQACGVSGLTIEVERVRRASDVGYRSVRAAAEAAAG